MIGTVIISAFPGTGKSYFQNSHENVLDSDSSLFSWLEKGVRHPDFPQNYINHIKENIGKAGVIMVSSHKVVRDALINNDIDFWLVYPAKELKEYYLQRYKDRGNEPAFIDMIDKNWDAFINELEGQEGCRKIVLTKGEYISDILKETA
jgi:hypothetical protein